MIKIMNSVMFYCHGVAELLGPARANSQSPRAMSAMEFPRKKSYVTSHSTSRHARQRAGRVTSRQARPRLSKHTVSFLFTPPLTNMVV